MTYMDLKPAPGESSGQFKRRMRRARAEWYAAKYAGQPTETPWARKPGRGTPLVSLPGVSRAQGKDTHASKRKRYAGLRRGYGSRPRGVVVPDLHTGAPVPRWLRRRAGKKAGAR